MQEIRHILLESGVYEIFRLVVVDSAYAGTYEIEKPNGWEEVNSIVDINDEYFNVDNFIIGESNKIRFLQYAENSGFEIIRNVYAEKGGDGNITFKWIAVKNEEEIDLLGDGFEINLNKYEEGYEQSMLYVETEIKKRESQSRLLNREDVSVDLFATENLDGNPITPVTTKEIYYKKGASRQTNFYFLSPSSSSNPATFGLTNNTFVMFGISERLNFGEIKGGSSKELIGYFNIGSSKIFLGDLLYTRSYLNDLSIELSNFHFFFTLRDSSNPLFNLVLRKKNGANVISETTLETSTVTSYNGYNGSEIKLVNKTYEAGNLKEGESIELVFKSVGNINGYFTTVDTSASIEVHSDFSSPMVKSRVITLHDALDQICKSATNGDLYLESKILDVGGMYHNTVIANGWFLRGIGNIISGNDKLTTSFKSLFYDSTSPLLAFGFDLQQDRLVVEPIEYFFNDTLAFDLSDKEFIEEDFKIYNDLDVSFNQLLFGGKKYSTGRKNDVLNGNTELEALTPLKTIKKKFDKRTDFIIDEDKIEDIIDDDSNASRNTDDDLVLIDLVDVTNYIDEGVLADCIHHLDGTLILMCYQTPFDTLPLTVGMTIEITSGLNVGTHTITNIDKHKLTLNTSSGVQTGTIDTPIRYIIPSATKNRNREGFSVVNNSRDDNTVANLRHNPKYQMARWFSFYGSGFSKKPNSDVITITDYKNNGEIQIEPSSNDLSNELQGLTTYNANETIGRLRSYKKPLFSGRAIEITLRDVNFSTFIDIYNIWRYGYGGDDILSRGYVTVPTPLGNLDVYPFGQGALEHNTLYNELTIKGKVKHNSGVPFVTPILDSVTIVDSDTVEMNWSYSDVITLGNVSLQVSKDNGSTWYELSTDVVATTSKSITDYAFFNGVIAGTDLMFRVSLDTNYYHGITSNVITKEWTYNNIVYVETLRSESEDCGFSVLEFEIIGSGTADVSWEFTSMPTGGDCVIRDLDTFGIIESFSSAPGVYPTPFSQTKTGSYLVNGVRKFRVELQAALATDGKILTCLHDIGYMYFMSARLGIDISETVSGYNIYKILYADEEMYDRKPPVV